MMVICSQCGGLIRQAKDFENLISRSDAIGQEIEDFKGHSSGDERTREDPHPDGWLGKLFFERESGLPLRYELHPGGKKHPDFLTPNGSTIEIRVSAHDPKGWTNPELKWDTNDDEKDYEKRGWLPTFFGLVALNRKTNEASLQGFALPEMIRTAPIRIVGEKKMRWLNHTNLFRQGEVCWCGNLAFVLPVAPTQWQDKFRLKGGN